MIVDDFLDYLQRGGVTDDFDFIQPYLWNEMPNSKTERYLVVQTSSGNGRLGELSANDYIDVIVVSAQNDLGWAAKKAESILQYVTNNPSDCNLNSVFNMGGLPNPIPTSDNRVIFRLSFRCLS
ncbi:phage tail termination protein [Providencia hangzhouensis]